MSRTDVLSYFAHCDVCAVRVEIDETGKLPPPWMSMREPDARYGGTPVDICSRHCGEAIVRNALDAMWPLEGEPS